MSESWFDSLVHARLRPAVARVYGREIVITPAGGEPVTLTALHIGSQREEPEVDGESGLSRTVRRDVTISTDPSCTQGGIAAPAANAAATIDGVVWSVETVAMLSGRRAKLTLVRMESVHRTRERYYGGA